MFTDIVATLTVGASFEIKCSWKVWRGDTTECRGPLLTLTQSRRTVCGGATSTRCSPMQPTRLRTSTHGLSTRDDSRKWRWRFLMHSSVYPVDRSRRALLLACISHREKEELRLKGDIALPNKGSKVYPTGCSSRDIDQSPFYPQFFVVFPSKFLCDPFAGNSLRIVRSRSNDWTSDSVVIINFTICFILSISTLLLATLEKTRESRKDSLPRCKLILGSGPSSYIETNLILSRYKDGVFNSV